MRTRLFGIALLGLVLAGPMLAGAAGQVPNPAEATVLLKSGERISGEFLDIRQNAVRLRTDDGRERRIPVSAVTVIDFGGPAENLPSVEFADATPEHQVILLTRGQRDIGQLVSIEREEEVVRREGTLYVTFRSADGRVDRYPIHVVKRLYLTDPPQAAIAYVPEEPARADLEPGISHHVTVPAQTRWTATNIRVREGQLVTFAAEGQIRLSFDAEDIATPAGSKVRRLAERAPMPQKLAGSLMGRIDNSEPFGIGDQTEPLRMPASGRLYLGINDDHFDDNQGAFHVTVTPQPVRRTTQD